MTRRRRLALIALAALAVALVVAPAALAAAGGGSSGFSGGGEGGGGGGGGSGFALFILFRLLIDIAVIGHGLGLLFLLGLAFLYWFVTRGLPKLQAWWAERAAQRSGGRQKTSKRERRVELAAAEAADEDPDFAPERVRAALARCSWTSRRHGTAVTGLPCAASSRPICWWSGSGGWTTLRAAAGTTMSSRWVSRRSSTSGSPHRRRRHRSRGGQDRRPGQGLRLDRSGRHLKRTGSLSEITRIREFWTLQKRGGRWTLASIEQGGEGKHALDEEIVPTAWADETGLRDEALVEGDVATRCPRARQVGRGRGPRVRWRRARPRSI